MLKKILSLTMIATLVFSLSACGNESNFNGYDKENVNIEAYHYVSDNNYESGVLLRHDKIHSNDEIVKLENNTDLNMYKFYNLENEVKSSDKYTLATSAKYDLFPRKYEYCEVDNNIEPAINEAMVENFPKEYKDYLLETPLMEKENIEAIIKCDFDGNGDSEKLVVYNAKYKIDVDKLMEEYEKELDFTNEFVSYAIEDYVSSISADSICGMIFVIDDNGKLDTIAIDKGEEISLRGIYDLNNDGKYEMVFHLEGWYGGQEVVSYCLNNSKWEEYLTSLIDAGR